MFRKKRFQSPLKPFTSGYKLEDYIIGNQIGKGSNAAVYEAAARFFPQQENNSKNSLVQLREEEEEEEAETTRCLTCCSLRTFPMAIKMMWNFGVNILQFSTLFPIILVLCWETDDRHTHISTEWYLFIPFVCRQGRRARRY